MNDFKKRLFINLGVLLGLIAALIGLLTVISWDLSKQKDKIVEQRRELNQRTQYFSVLASLQKKYNEVQKYSSVLSNVLPQYEELFKFTEELNLAAKERKLGFGFSFAGEQPASEGAAGTANFNLSIQGKEGEVLNFLNFIENMRFLVNLFNLDMVKSDAGFDLTANGQVFFQ